MDHSVQLVAEIMTLSISYAMHHFENENKPRRFEKMLSNRPQDVAWVVDKIRLHYKDYKVSFKLLT